MKTTIYTTTNYQGDQLFRIIHNGEKFHYHHGYNIQTFKGDWTPEKWELFYESEEFESIEDIKSWFAVQILIFESNEQSKRKAERIAKIKAIGYNEEQAQAIDKANILFELTDRIRLKKENSLLVEELNKAKQELKAVKEGYKSLADKNRSILKKEKKERAERINGIINKLKKAKKEGSNYIALLREYSNKGRTFKGIRAEFRVEKPTTKEYLVLKATKAMAEELLNKTKI